MVRQIVDMKIVLLGQAAVGKTSLLQCYMNNKFSSTQQPNVGGAFGRKIVAAGDRDTTLNIWDTAGGEQYNAISRTYYCGASAAIICFDVKSSESFDKAKFWIDELRHVEERCQIYICGTKLDIVINEKKKRGVACQTVTDFADKVGSEVFETSSKTGENVEELLNRIVQDYQIKLDREKKEVENSGFILQDSPKKSKWKCSSCMI